MGEKQVGVVYVESLSFAVRNLLLGIWGQVAMFVFVILDDRFRPVD